MSLRTSLYKNSQVSSASSKGMTRVCLTIDRKILKCWKRQKVDLVLLRLG